MNYPAGRYWPMVFAPHAAVALTGVPCSYTLTAHGEAALAADLEADAEAEAG